MSECQNKFRSVNKYFEVAIHISEWQCIFQSGITYFGEDGMCSGERGGGGGGGRSIVRDQQHTFVFIIFILTTICPALFSRFPIRDLFPDFHIHHYISILNQTRICISKITINKSTSALLKIPARTHPSTCSAHFPSASVSFKGASNAIVTHALATTPAQTYHREGTRSRRYTIPSSTLVLPGNKRRTKPTREDLKGPAQPDPKPSLAR